MQEPIRVLIVNGKMICGGIESFIMNIYRHIDRSKVQFDFLVHYKERFFYDDEIESMGGKIHRLTFRNDNNYFKYKKDLKRFFQENPQYQIVWGQMEGLASIYLKEAKKAGVKVTIAHSHITSAERSLKGLIKRILRKNVNKHADYKFACSTEAGRYLFGKQPFTLIANAVKTERFLFDAETRERIRRDQGWDEEHFVLGHIGRFNAQKNHKYLIDIFAEYVKRNANARLCLCGDGELMPSVKEYAGKKGVLDKITFTGNIPNVNEYYQAFDIFVMPSLYEGLPVSGIEAQVSGLPCLFADTITREAGILEDRTQFLPITQSPEIWAEAIVKQNCVDRKIDNETLLKDYNIRYNAEKLSDFFKEKHNS